MNGSGITNDEWTSVHSGMSEFESTMIASLPLNAVNCTAAGGISCVFDNGNGSYRVESPMMDCPTGMYDSVMQCQCHCMHTARRYFSGSLPFTCYSLCLLYCCLPVYPY